MSLIAGGGACSRRQPSPTANVAAANQITDLEIDEIPYDVAIEFARSLAIETRDYLQELKSDSVRRYGETMRPKE